MWVCLAGTIQIFEFFMNKMWDILYFSTMK